MNSLLIEMVPEERRPTAMLIAALDLLAELSVRTGGTDDMEPDEVRQTIQEMLEDAVEMGVIKSSRRVLNRLEIVIA